MGTDSGVTHSAEKDLSLKVVLGALTGYCSLILLCGCRGRKWEYIVASADCQILVKGATGSAVVLLALHTSVLRVT